MFFLLPFCFLLDVFLSDAAVFLHVISVFYCLCISLVWAELLFHNYVLCWFIICIIQLFHFVSLSAALKTRPFLNSHWTANTESSFGLDAHSFISVSHQFILIFSEKTKLRSAAPSAAPSCFLRQCKMCRSEQKKHLANNVDQSGCSNWEDVHIKSSLIKNVTIITKSRGTNCLSVA